MVPRTEHTFPRLIYFAGVDGCGKSTIIDEIIKEYEKRGFRARSVWLRFNYFFTRPVLLLCRIIGLTRREKKGGKIYSIHDFHKSKSFARIVQYLHFLDTVFAYIAKVWIPMKFTNEVILCDKFVYDILADYMVESRDLNLMNKNIAKLLVSLIPDDMTVIFFTVDKEEIIKRKPEVLIDDEDYNFKYTIYELINKKFSMTIIENINFHSTLHEVKKILKL